MLVYIWRSVNRKCGKMYPVPSEIRAARLAPVFITLLAVCRRVILDHAPYLPVRCLFLCVVCFCSLFAPNLSISYFRFSVESLLLYCTIIHVLYRPFPKKNCLSEKRNSRRLTHSLSHPFAPCYLLLFPLITSLFDRRLNKSLI